MFLSQIRKIYIKFQNSGRIWSLLLPVVGPHGHLAILKIYSSNPLSSFGPSYLLTFIHLFIYIFTAQSCICLLLIFPYLIMISVHFMFVKEDNGIGAKPKPVFFQENKQKILPRVSCFPWNDQILSKHMAVSWSFCSTHMSTVSFLSGCASSQQVYHSPPSSPFNFKQLYSMDVGSGDERVGAEKRGQEAHYPSLNSDEKNTKIHSSHVTLNN